MIGIILRVVAFLALGVALGVAHSRAVAEGERIFRETGERARPAALFLVRLVVLCVIFGAIGKTGPVPLGAAILGFFGARVMVPRG
jgi:hypothetical protein